MPIYTRTQAHIRYTLQAEGAHALASALPELPALRDLHLAGNVLGDSGVVALAGAATCLTALASLQLQVGGCVGACA